MNWKICSQRLGSTPEAKWVATPNVYVISSVVSYFAKYLWWDPNKSMLCSYFVSTTSRTRVNFFHLPVRHEWLAP